MPVTWNLRIWRNSSVSYWTSLSSCWYVLFINIPNNVNTVAWFQLTADERREGFRCILSKFELFRGDNMLIIIYIVQGFCLSFKEHLFWWTSICGWPVTRLIINKACMGAAPCNSILFLPNPTLHYFSESGPL